MLCMLSDQTKLTQKFKERKEKQNETLDSYMLQLKVKK